MLLDEVVIVRKETLRILAILLVFILLLFGLDPLGLWLVVDIVPPYPHMPGWGIYIGWLLVLALVGTVRLGYYLFVEGVGEEEKKPESVLPAVAAEEKK